MAFTQWQKKPPNFYVYMLSAENKYIYIHPNIEIAVFFSGSNQKSYFIYFWYKDETWIQKTEE